MPNYGDVALNLRPDFDRSMVVHSMLLNTLVGHVGGKADMHLEDAPDELHQFQFVNMADRDKLSLAKMKGYKFVKKSEKWWINEDVFTWTPEGFAENTGGDRAMFRPASLYLKEQAQMTDEQKRRKRAQQQEDAAEEAKVLKVGGQVAVLDGSGRELRPARGRAGA